MSLTTPQERKAFLDRFFGLDRNRKWDDTWLDYIVSVGLPHIIPFWRRVEAPLSGWQLQIWCLSLDVATFRTLQDECRAFLGKNSLLERDLQSNFSEWGLDGIVHGRVRLPSWRQEPDEVLNSALNDWLRVRKDRESEYKPNLSEGSSGARLRELRRVYEQCLTTHDRPGAQGALRALEEAGLLERTNLLFLRIRLLAYFEEWEAIVEDANFADIMAVRRTDSVTEAMLQAVYHTRLAATADDLPVLFKEFQAVYEEYRPLFRGRGGLRSPEVMRLFTLYAVVLLGSTTEEVNAILDDSTVSAEERAYLQSLVKYAASTRPHKQGSAVIPSTASNAASIHPTVLDAVKTALENGRDDRVVALVPKTPSSVDKVATLLSFARDTDSLIARTIALQSLQELKTSDRAVVMNSRPLRSDISRLVNGGKKLSPKPATSIIPDASPRLPFLPVETVPPKTIVPPLSPPQPQTIPPVERAAMEALPIIPALAPTNWPEWLEAVRTGDFGTEALYDIAESGTVQWTVSSIAENPVRARTFAKDIESLRDYGTSNEKQVFFDALPLIIRSVTSGDGEFPRPTAAVVYHSLRQTVAFDLQFIQFDRNTLILFYDLLVASLATGEAADYRAMLDEVGSFWDKNAPIYAHSLLDLLDALQDYPAHDQEARQSLATKALSVVSAWQQANRIEASDLAYARRLALEYGLGEMLPIAPALPSDEVNAEEDLDWNRLSGKRIGVYTLMESAANRVRSLIQENCPNCAVIANAEKSGSETLKQFAQTADILIIVTGCAKHAATEFLERWMPPGRPLLRPAGRGSSSVLSVLENYLRESSR